MKYIVPQELRSETKLWKWVYLKDLIFVVAFVLILNMMSVFIAEELHTVYFIYNILVAVSLTIRTPSNPQKRLYHSIYYALIKDKGVYKPL